MPNFKCEHLKSLDLPFQDKDVKFIKAFKNIHQNIFLLLSEVEKESFFLQISPSNKGFLIKGDKHSKPTQVGFLQLALKIFKESFCKNIFNEAISLKNTRLITPSKIIENDIQKLEQRLKNFKQVFIEIGFGSGRHLLFQAEQNPDVLILGIEIYTPALEQVAKLAENKGLNNILLTQNDARILFCVLENESIDKVFLHFPVPWPKQPLRRVISKAFISSLLRVLKSECSFELRTDDKEYFNYALELFLMLQKTQILLFKNKNLNITSKYEARWKRQEKDIYDLIFTKKELSDQEYKKEEFELEKLDDSALKRLKAKFKQEKIRGEDFFLSIENLYEEYLKLDESLLLNHQNNFASQLMLKIAYGDFDKPQHSYILLSTEQSIFLFKKPFFTSSNLKALKALNNFLNQFKNH